MELNDLPTQAQEKYAVIGIHGEVARVRMFIGEEIIDEDFELPELFPGMVGDISTYTPLLQDAIENRVARLEQQNV